MKSSRPTTTSCGCRSDGRSSRSRLVAVGWCAGALPQRKCRSIRPPNAGEKARQSGRDFMKLALAGALALAMAGAAIADTAWAEPVKTKVTGGTVVGDLADGIATYKGVPYAAPPLGDLRWKAPQPV